MKADDQADDEDLNRLFRALGDATRRRIIDELAKREDQSLFEIYTRVLDNQGLGQTRQGFSRHLTVLEDAGIIETKWQGTTKLHRLNTKPLARLGNGWLSRFNGEPK